MTAARLTACVLVMLSAGCGSLRPPRRPLPPPGLPEDGAFSSALAHYAEGLLLEADSGRVSSAAGDAYAQAHRLDPDSEPPFSLAIISLMEGGRTNEALALVKAQVRRKPDSVDAWLTLGQITEVSEDYRQAAAAYARVRALRGRGEASAGATLGEIRNRFKAGQDRTAVRLLRQLATATNLPPVVARAPALWARHFLLETKTPERALPVIQIMVDTASDANEQAATMTLYGDALCRAGSTNRALRAYWHVLKIQPDAVSAAQRIGMVLYEQADTNGVTRLSASIPKARQPLGQALAVSFAWTLFDQPEAAADALLAGRDAARHADIWPSESYYLLLGAALDDLERDDKATAVFGEALSTYTNAHTIMNHLAYMWAVNDERHDEALAWIERALTHEPRNHAYLDTLGWVYFRLGRLRDALTQLLLAARLAPREDSVIFDHVGDVLHALDRREEAVSFWRRAATLDPDLAGLRNKIETVRPAVDDRP